MQSSQWKHKFWHKSLAYPFTVALRALFPFAGVLFLHFGSYCFNSMLIAAHRQATDVAAGRDGEQQWGCAAFAEPQDTIRRRYTLRRQIAMIRSLHVAPRICFYFEMHVVSDVRHCAHFCTGPSTLVAACAPSGRKAKPRNFLSPSAIGAAAAAARLSIANVSLNRDQHGSQPVCFRRWCLRRLGRWRSCYHVKPFIWSMAVRSTWKRKHTCITAAAASLPSFDIDDDKTMLRGALLEMM